MPRRFLACFRPHRSPKALHDRATAEATAGQEQRPVGAPAVLVELFSSQGCSTSPAAELLLSRLGRGDFELEIPVVLIAHHVDYWDYKGWKDPYGSSQSTVRQKWYVESLRLDTMFTPMVVVQGRSHCEGTDEEAIISLVKSAPLFPALSFQANFERPSPETLQVTISGPLHTKLDGGSGLTNIMVALHEKGLVTDIQGGENDGKVTSNDYVVRKLEKLCTINDLTSSKKPLSETSITFPLWEGFNSGKCGIAVFIQNELQQIFGCQNIPLPKKL